MCDEEAVRRFQNALGLRPDGVVGPRTRQAIRAVRSEAGPAAVGLTTTQLDPADEGAVRAFQEGHGLTVDGVVGKETRQLLRYEAEHLLGIDPADPATIAAFQAEHGLEADGVIGPETRGAIRAERESREAHDRADRDERYGRFADGGDGVAIDPADRDSVERFQRRYGLEPDGVVGPRTQVALRTVGQPRPQPSPRPRPHHPYRRRAMSSGLFSSAAFPAVDDDLDIEMDAVEQAIRSGGPATRSEIARRVNAHHWGPGRLHIALRGAIEDGRLRRNGRRYEPSDTAEHAGTGRERR